MEGPEDRLSRKDRRTPSSRRTRGRLLPEGLENPLSEVDDVLSPVELELEETLQLPPEERQGREKLLIAEESLVPPSDSAWHNDESLTDDELERMLNHEENEVSG
jgi:hypothetical protein